MLFLILLFALAGQALGAAGDVVNLTSDKDFAKEVLQFPGIG